MKKQLTIILSIVLLLIAIVSITWVGAYNGAIEKNNDVIEKKVGVHAAMAARYEKVDAFIDAIEGANETVQGFLDTIMEAREAFVNAIASNNIDAADETIDTIDGTFINLISYMENNPSSYNTVNLYSGYMAEFSAATNVVTNAILTYNSSVTAYNNHIERFPNNLFLGAREAHKPYSVENYNKPLPKFNE